VLRLGLDRYPRLRLVPAKVIPHGHFRSEYPNTISREEARARLNVASASVVYVYMGLIRPYKNVPGLVRVFADVKDPDAALVVAGMPITDDLRADVTNAADGDLRVRLDLRWIDDDEVQTYLNAADLVVLPFAEI